MLCVTFGTILKKTVSYFSPHVFRLNQANQKGRKRAPLYPSLTTYGGTFGSQLTCKLTLCWLAAPLESQRYCTVHCTGYMRIWPTRQLGTEGEAEVDKESSHFSCLVAVGRVHPHTLPQANGEIKVKPTEFVTRYAMDGKFTFVDQRLVYSCFRKK